MNKAVLKLSSVSKIFNHNEHHTTILKDISVEFVQGCLYAIRGASGAGKSTLLHIIAGLDAPTSGSIFFNNRALHVLNPREYAEHLNTTIGLMFQSAYLIKELTVMENVMLPGLIKKNGVVDSKKKAINFLERVGLSDKLDSFVGELSGGQQQRVTLARALMNEPLFLIADEPTGNLDTYTGNAVIDLIIECQKKWGMGVIISSHDAYVSEKMEVILELNNGALIQHNNDKTICYPQKKSLQKQFK